jgi:alanine-synthesizing transaminase
MFSLRVPCHLETNRLSRALDRARAEGRALIDLTVTNPTASGIEYPPGVLASLSCAAAGVYDPEPFGLFRAREAVSRDYARRGVAVPPSRVILTASTSEAYSLLFKLLCEPSGDSVLVPAPSYPLFDHLTRLDGVTTAAYSLEYDGRWALDFDTVDTAWTGRTRAVLAVSPNNPTGSVLSVSEIKQLAARCAARDAALIVDEVFADYPLAASPERPVRNPDSRLTNPEARAPGPECLTFRLGGLSKSAGLPHVKLGWIAVDGPDALVAPALERLEFICDTYLSVSTPVQVAADTLIAEGASTRGRILDRVRGNYARLRDLGDSYKSVDVLPVDAGWSAVLRIPSRATEEEIVLELLQRDGVVVHPGFFFDFPHEAFLVVSLLPEPQAFADGIRRVLERVHL